MPKNQCHRTKRPRPSVVAFECGNRAREGKFSHRTSPGGGGQNSRSERSRSDRSSGTVPRSNRSGPSPTNTIIHRSKYVCELPHFFILLILANRVGREICSESMHQRLAVRVSTHGVTLVQLRVGVGVLAACIGPMLPADHRGLEAATECRFKNSLK